MIVLAMLLGARGADPVVDALVREVQRSAAELRLPDQPAPYFVGYRMRFVESLTVHAQLGGIVDVDDRPWRGLGVEVRVGSQEFDNTNFVASAWSGGDGIGFTLTVVDEAPAAIAGDAWLRTDQDFKDAVENYSRKKAAADRQAEVDDVPDFAPGPPQQHDAPLPPALDADRIVELTRSLSEVFLSHPDIEWSSVQGRAESGREVVIDSRGALVSEPRAYVEIVAAARVRADDGETAVDQESWVVRTADQLPDAAAMTSAVEELAARLECWRKAPRLTEEYVGPILFEGDAAVTAFRLGLLPRLVGTPEPERPAEGTRTVSTTRKERPEPLRIRRRVLPEDFTVTDDPTADPSLPSSYAFDSEGEPAQAITLISNGIVRTHYASRTPSRAVPASNGHGRGQLWGLPRGAPSWTRIESRDTVSSRKMHRTAMRSAGEYDLDSYVRIRHISDPSLAPFRGGAAFVLGARASDQPLELVDAVRVFADGHEEPFRGLALPTATAAMFRDVVASGASTTRSQVSAEQGYAMTLTAPSILLGEAELAPTEDKGQKVPRLQNPLAER